MTINNEAILTSLIENEHVEVDEIGRYLDVEGNQYLQPAFDPVEYVSDFELVMRALFDECDKRDIDIRVKNNKLIIKMNFMDSQFAIMDFMDSQLIILDTSRESFALAYQKVVGINGN